MTTWLSNTVGVTRRWCISRRALARVALAVPVVVIALALGVGAARPANAVAAPGSSTSHAASTSKDGGSSGSSCSSGSKLGTLGDLVSLNIGKLSKSITCGVVEALFPSTSHGLGTKFITSLISTPNYGQDGTNVSQVGKNTVAVALGLAPNMIAFAIVWYWLSGFMNGGGIAGAEGIARGVGAILLIVLWPWLFGQIVAVGNALSASVLTSGMQSRLGTQLLPWLALSAPILGSGVGIIAGILLFIFCLVLTIALLLLKMAIGVGLAVAFVAVPILVALGILPELAWMARAAFKGVAVMVLIPFMWAVVMIVFTGFLGDTLTFGNFGIKGVGVWGTLVRPLAMIMLLFLMLGLPFTLWRLASLSAVLPSGGAENFGSTFMGATISRTLSRVMGKGATDAVGKVAHGGLEDVMDKFRSDEGWAKKAEEWGAAARETADAGDATVDDAKNQASYSDVFGEHMTNEEFSEALDDMGLSGEEGSGKQGKKGQRMRNRGKGSWQQGENVPEGGGSGQEPGQSAGDEEVSFEDVFGEAGTAAAATAAPEATLAAEAVSSSGAGDAGARGADASATETLRAAGPGAESQSAEEVAAADNAAAGTPSADQVATDGGQGAPTSAEEVVEYVGTDPDGTWVLDSAGSAPGGSGGPGAPGEAGPGGESRGGPGDSATPPTGEWVEAPSSVPGYHVEVGTPVTHGPFEDGDETPATPPRSDETPT